MQTSSRCKRRFILDNGGECYSLTLLPYFQSSDVPEWPLAQNGFLADLAWQHKIAYFSSCISRAKACKGLGSQSRGLRITVKMAREKFIEDAEARNLSENMSEMRMPRD